MTTRNCTRCEGTGIKAAYTVGAYHSPAQPCNWCKGTGTFSEPNLDAILDAIRGRKGLRTKRPDEDRAYYVWRMARFHGGADVTMPMTASLSVIGDPFQPELDAISEAVARRVYGTDLAAAHRWGRALGHIDRDMPGLPPSAYSGGPVADENKPEEEAQELV